MIRHYAPEDFYYQARHVYCLRGWYVYARMRHYCEWKVIPQLFVLRAIDLLSYVQSQVSLLMLPSLRFQLCLQR
jgi:hypothetical protein